MDLLLIEKRDLKLDAIVFAKEPGDIQIGAAFILILAIAFQ
jgi:hypothetical protein